MRGCGSAGAAVHKMRVIVRENSCGSINKMRVIVRENSCGGMNKMFVIALMFVCLFVVANKFNIFYKFNTRYDVR